MFMLVLWLFNWDYESQPKYKNEFDNVMDLFFFLKK